jgi:hypothetical protein
MSMVCVLSALFCEFSDCDVHNYVEFGGIEFVLRYMYRACSKNVNRDFKRTMNVVCILLYVCAIFLHTTFTMTLNFAALD